MEFIKIESGWYLTMSNYVFDESIELAENAMLKVRPELFDEWNFEKNNRLELDIYKISKGSHKLVWWICDKGHEWETRLNNRATGHFTGCPYCSNRKIIVGYNDMWTTNPELAKLLANPEDGYKYMQSGSQRVDWKCMFCKNIIKNKKICSINRGGLFCSFCSDGISYPEKIMRSVLEQSNVIYEFQKSINNNSFIYDFYLPDYNCIIETHGMQHYEDIARHGARKLKEEQDNDMLKREFATSSGIKDYIIIDCRKSDLNWIKNNIISSLNHIISLDKINWSKCEKDSLTSIVEKACTLYNDGIHSTKELSDKLNIGTVTVWKYLKRCKNAKICDYNPEINKKAGGIKNSITVIQLDKHDEKVKEWNSLAEAERVLRISKGKISDVCKNKRKTAGGFKWMYKEDYENIFKENNI